MIFDLAYVGSSSKNLVRRENINAPVLGATFNQPTRTQREARKLQRELRAAHGLPAVPGYSDLNMYKYNGFSSYNSLQTSLQRRQQRVDVRGLLRLEQEPHDQHVRHTSDGIPGGIRGDHATIGQYDYSYSSWDTTTSSSDFVYQTPKKAHRVLRAWQLWGSSACRAGASLPDRVLDPDANNNNNLSGTSNPAAGIVVTCDPGSASLRRSRAATASSRPGASMGHEQPRPVDLQGSQDEGAPGTAQRAQPHPVQQGVNSQANRGVNDPRPTCLQRGRTLVTTSQQVRHHQRGVSPADHPADVRSSLIVDCTWVSISPERAPAISFSARPQRRSTVESPAR